MTKTQRQKHIKALRHECEIRLTEDSWGNYKPASGNYRIKFKAVNYRVERKVAGGWMRIAGDNLTKTTVESMIRTAEAIASR